MSGLIVPGARVFGTPPVHGMIAALRCMLLRSAEDVRPPPRYEPWRGGFLGPVFEDAAIEREIRRL